MKNINAQRKLTLQLLVTAIAFGGLITGTFAWFSVANDVSIGTFNITYGEADKIQFGLIVPANRPDLGEAGSLTFFDNLSDADLVAYGYNDKESPLSPVSSMFQSLWLNESTLLDDNTLFPVLRSSYSTYQNTTNSNQARSGFFQFEFYLKSNMDMYLYLDSTASIVADSFVNSQKNVQNAIELDKISASLRVSFLSSLGFNIWEPNTEVAGTTAFGGRLDVLDQDGYYDFDGSLGDYHEIMFGEYNDASKLVYSETSRASAEKPFTSFNASTAKDVNPLDLETSIENGLVVVHEDSKTTATLADQTLNSSALAYLPEYTPTRLVVTVYAEGWDLDNTNLIQDASFLLNLTLTGRFRAPTEPLTLKNEVVE
ncbi:MAG: hypothetical protein NTV44_04955 [Firmicutes bacterium]|nr:hypothetical protein [Bacillota bacterium]